MSFVPEINASAKRREINFGTGSYPDELAEEYAKGTGIKPRPAETISEIDERGAFVRQANSLIQPFGSGPNDLKAESGRYAVYWQEGCHWSNRPVIARDLLGLTDVIRDQKTSGSGVSRVYGHGFGAEPDHKDPITGVHFLSEFYVKANPDYEGRATTPTLVDIAEKKAVNNDYHRLSNYIEVQFRPFQPKDAPDLYPKKFRREIDQLNDWLFPHINNSHYRMAFCQSAEAYEEAYADFFESLGKLDERLRTNRFLFGDYVTDADIRLYVTLVRWEIHYFRSIGPMLRRITTYENLWGYVKDLYGDPVFKKYTFFPTAPETNDPKHNRNFITRIAWQYDWDQLWTPDGSRAALSSNPNDRYLRHPADETPEAYQSIISVSHWNSPSWADRDPSDPANSPLDQDASINPINLNEAYD